MAHMLLTQAINPSLKNLVHNLQFGPQTWLVRGKYLKMLPCISNLYDSIQMQNSC